jgi:hypothetical protein
VTHSKQNEVFPQHEENRLVREGQRVLLDGGYPNPDRVGCPGHEVLKGLAQRKIDMLEAEGAVLHLGSCSPCFIEYTSFQKQAARRSALELASAAIALLILAIVAGRIWKAEVTKHAKSNLAVTAPERVTLDLRNRLVFRDEAPPSANSGPIQLRRGRFDLTMLLPAGSEPGEYKVEVLDVSEKSLIATSGAAVNQDDSTALNVELDVSHLSPGTYILAVGTLGGEQKEYPLTIK